MPPRSKNLLKKRGKINTKRGDKTKTLIKQKGKRKKKEKTEEKKNRRNNKKQPKNRSWKSVIWKSTSIPIEIKP
jgi:hypothetical protein